MAMPPALPSASSSSLPSGPAGPSSQVQKLPGHIELISPSVTLGKNILMLALSLLLSCPLYKLSKTRTVIVLLLSKTLGTILASSMISFIVFSNIVNLLSPDAQSVLASLMSVHPGFVRIHLLALAMNRVQSVFSPITYSSKGNKKFIWSIFIGIWIFSAYQAITHTFFPGFFLTFFAGKYFNQYTVFAATILYICISARLLQLRFTSSLGNQSEIDHVQICIVCMLGLLPFLYASLVPGWIADTQIYAANQDWLPNVLEMVLNIDNDLCFFIEDICLLIICRDFRRMFFFCCSTNNFNNNNNGRIISVTHENNDNFIGQGTTFVDDGIQTRVMRQEITNNNENENTTTRANRFSSFPTSSNIRRPSQMIQIN